MSSHTHYRVGIFTLDPVAKVLFREGQPVHLTRKAVETLLVLAENPGQVVTKEELMRAVWPDRVVEEANVAQNIAVVRKALAAEPGAPAYIETFPGRGYRLEGPVLRESVSADTGTALAKPASRRWAFTLGAAGLIAAGLLLWRALPAADPMRDLKLSPWTRAAGKEFQPALSEDGQWLAYLWVEQPGSAPGVFVQKAGQDAPTRVSSGSGTHSSPCWSPDGRQLAFLRVGREFTEVLTVPREGGAPRVVTRLTPPNYGIERRLLDWSPDGATLVVAHADSPGRPIALWLVDAASGSRRLLTQPASDDRGDVEPRFSPDGRAVSFIREFHRNRQELFIVPAAGGNARALTSLRGQITGQDWAEQGLALLYASDQNGEYRLWRMNSSGSPKPQPLPVYGEFPIQLSLARRARVMAYASLHQDRNIWEFDLQTKEWKRLVASTAQDASPQYSPDGRSILFRSDRGGVEQLWISDASGGGARQVTNDKELRPSVGRWSPDGRMIVFNDPASRAIWIAERTADGWRSRSLQAAGVHPVFSPDGRWIYAGGLTEIVRVPAGGGRAESVVKSRAESLNISHDGLWIYFVREPNDTVLWRASTTAGQVEKVLDGLVPSCTSCYAVSPEGVYYLGSQADNYDRQLLYFRHQNTRRTAAITEYPEPLWPIGSGPFSLSPDGRRLLTVRVDPSSSDVMRVDWGGPK